MLLEENEFQNCVLRAVEGERRRGNKRLKLIDDVKKLDKTELRK